MAVRNELLYINNFLMVAMSAIEQTNIFNKYILYWYKVILTMLHDGMSQKAREKSNGHIVLILIN